MTPPPTPSATPEPIRERLSKITEGPWKYSVSLGPERGDYRVYVYREYLGVQDVVAALLGDETTDAKADADFIAHAPDDIRALLDTAESRARVNDQLITERKELIESNAILRAERDAATAQLAALTPTDDELRDANMSGVLDCTDWRQWKAKHDEALVIIEGLVKRLDSATGDRWRNDPTRFGPR